MKTQIINATCLLADGPFSFGQNKLNQKTFPFLRAYLTNLLSLLTFRQRLK